MSVCQLCQFPADLWAGAQWTARAASPKTPSGDLSPHHRASLWAGSPAYPKVFGKLFGLSIDLSKMKKSKPSQVPSFQSLICLLLL